MQCWSLEPSGEGVVCWMTLVHLPRQTHSIYTSWHKQARQKQNCIDPNIYLSVKLGGTGGMLPQENFFKFDAVR